MPRYAYDRLSAQDHMFLLAEAPNMPMHIAALQVAEAGELARDDGGIDVARYQAGLESVLHRIPRYRQRLEFLPLSDRPVWVDDAHFNLDYHVRHASLPAPGTLDQLKSLVSRIVSRPLDRARPLWEVWVVEGLEAGTQFALVSKIHHCMIDGAAGADLASVLASPSPNVSDPIRIPFLPKPAPSFTEVRLDDARRMLGLPMRAARGVADLIAGEDSAVEVAEARMRAVGELASWTARPASSTPLNGTLGPHRDFDFLTMPLPDVKDVKNVFGCTLNDVVLATVCGAVRGYMLRRCVDPSELDFRISIPVGMRGEGQRPSMGNFLSSWILPLPIRVEAPEDRIHAITEATGKLKESRADLGFDTLMSVAEWLPGSITKLGARAAAMPANMIVTNVPGPQFPLYQLGSKILGTYPMVPCLPGSGLGVALFSYDGKLCWGFNADPGLVPDLGAFVALIKASFEELRNAAARKVTQPRRVRTLGLDEIEGAESDDAVAQQYMPPLAMM